MTLDVNGDGRISAFDALRVVNYLNVRASQATVIPAPASPEGEADDFFSSLGGAGSQPDDLLGILADDQVAQRRRRQ